MKSLLLLMLLLAIIATSGCNTTVKDNENSTKQNAEELNAILKRFDPSSQIYRVDFKVPSIIKGRKGTVINVAPSYLEDSNGKAVADSITVELKELTNQNELLLANAQTASDGKLLVSGGAYYINMTAGGQQLRLRNASTFKVAFPKISERPMNLFYGQRDSLGKMNWINSGDKLTKSEEKVKAEHKKQSTDITTNDDIDRVLEYADTFCSFNEHDGDAALNLGPERKKEIAFNILYKAVALNKFGWINCDAFCEADPRTNLKCIVDSIGNIQYLGSYLIFKDINSIMTPSAQDKMLRISFDDIPLGADVTLIVISYKQGKFYGYKNKMKVPDNASIKIQLHLKTEEEMKEFFN